MQGCVKDAIQSDKSEKDYKRTGRGNKKIYEIGSPYRNCLFFIISSAFCNSNDISLIFAESGNLGRQAGVLDS